MARSSGSVPRSKGMIPSVDRMIRGLVSGEDDKDGAEETGDITDIADIADTTNTENAENTQKHGETQRQTATSLASPTTYDDATRFARAARATNRADLWRRVPEWFDRQSGSFDAVTFAIAVARIVSNHTERTTSKRHGQTPLTERRAPAFEPPLNN